MWFACGPVRLALLAPAFYSNQGGFPPNPYTEESAWAYFALRTPLALEGAFRLWGPRQEGRGLRVIRGIEALANRKAGGQEGHTSVNRQQVLRYRWWPGRLHRHSEGLVGRGIPAHQQSERSEAQELQNLERGRGIHKETHRRGQAGGLWRSSCPTGGRLRREGRGQRPNPRAKGRTGQ